MSKKKNQIKYFYQILSDIKNNKRVCRKLAKF